MFGKEAITLINRSDRVTKSSATFKDNIFTNDVFRTSFKKGISKILFQSTSQYLQRLNFQMKKLKTEK